MKFSKQIKPISYLKSHAAKIVDNITKNREPMIITQNGEAKLVVLDVKTFEEYEETLATLKILAQGNQQIDQGQFRSADELFSELDSD